MGIYAMESGCIVLITILQVVTLTTSINQASTITDYRQVITHGRALGNRSGQLLQQVSVVTDRTFAGTSRLPETQQRAADNRRPLPLTINAFIQRHKQQQQPIQQPQPQPQPQLNGPTMSYMDRTLIMLPKELPQTAATPSVIYGPHVRQQDAIVTFVTIPPRENDDEGLAQYPWVQSFDDESADDYYGYRHVTATALPEQNNNKHDQVTYYVTNGTTVADEHRKNLDSLLEHDNGVNTTKGRSDKHPPRVPQSDEKNNDERQPLQSNGSDFEHQPPKALHSAKSQKQNTGQIVELNDQMYRESQRFRLPENIDGDDNQRHVNVDEKGNSTDVVDTDAKARKQEYGGNSSYSKNVQRIGNRLHANVTAAGLHDKMKIEIERHRKPSVVPEVNPKTTALPSQRRRKPSSDQTIADDNNGHRDYEQKDNLRRTAAPMNDKHPLTVTTTSPTPVLVVDRNEDGGVAEELEKEQEQQAGQGGYGYQYTVLDENAGMDFGQWERREPGRTGTVTGLYRVRLPDGRTQTVEYTVGRDTGYRASVTYEGVQRHPVAAPRPPPPAERYESTAAEMQSSY